MKEKFLLWIVLSRESLLRESGNEGKWTDKIPGLKREKMPF